MAYGRTNHNLLHRAISIGVGDLTSSKFLGLRTLRQKYLEAAQAMVNLVWLDEPLVHSTFSKEFDAILCRFQKDFKGLNKAYVEKARIAVKEAVKESTRRYFNTLVGRLANCSGEVEETETRKKARTGEPLKPVRKYYFVPVDIQDAITPEELQALESYVKTHGFQKTISLFQKVIVHGEAPGLTSYQVSVIKEIHRQAKSRHNPPAFGTDPSYTCQIHLDYRVLPGPVNPVERIDSEARILLDSANTKYYSFLEIATPIPASRKSKPILYPWCSRRRH